MQHPRNRNSPICYDFVKKQCVRGPECRYSHDLDSIIHGTSARDAALLARCAACPPHCGCVYYRRVGGGRAATAGWGPIDPMCPACCILVKTGVLADARHHQRLLSMEHCDRAGLGGSGVPLASDAALAAALSGNVPFLPGAAPPLL